MLNSPQPYASLLHADKILFLWEKTFKNMILYKEALSRILPPRYAQCTDPYYVICNINFCFCLNGFLPASSVDKCHYDRMCVFLFIHLHTWY